MSKWTSTSVVINSATEEMVKSALKDGWNFERQSEQIIRMLYGRWQNKYLK